jgi:uncharacterized integral membrane protein (TIGR00697 family)
MREYDKGPTAMEEFSLFLRIILDLGFVFFMCRLGKEYLYASIVVNLILISVIGSKLVTVFGFVTNTGNAFYASVFFATYLLLEHGRDGSGVKDGIRAILIGVVSIFFFTVMSQLAVAIVSIPETASVSSAMSLLFGAVPRITLASLTAYAVAQSMNVWLYFMFDEAFEQKRLWLRVFSAIIIAQAVDSLLFFSIAFLGVVPFETVLESMATGYFLKVGIGAISIPLLYASYRIHTPRLALEHVRAS